MKKIKEKYYDKKKYLKKKSSSSSSSPSFASSTPESFDVKLNHHRIEYNKKRKLAKIQAKKSETLREKQERRSAKKLLKEENQKTSILPDSLPYTNSNNPFNDNHLTEIFVWNKKLEAEKKNNLSKKQIEKLNRERICRNVAEMEELKRNRDARQAIKEDMEILTREQEKSQYSDWRRVEDSFHLKQAKLRSKIRIQEGRAKAIDLLARYISFYDLKKDDEEQNEFELVEPLVYLKECNEVDFEDLLADIKVYKVIENGKNEEFWNDITTIAQHELKKKLEHKKVEYGYTAVECDVLNIFKDKSLDELERLNIQIQDKIKNAGRNTDLSYWETTLQSLKLYMAKHRLKQIHSKFLKLKLKKIREEQNRETIKHEEKLGFELPKSPKSNNFNIKIEAKYLNKKDNELNQFLPFTIKELEKLDDESREQKWQLLNVEQLENFAIQLYNYGRYSPKYGNESEAMPGIDILEQDKDFKNIDIMRQKQKEMDINKNFSQEHLKMLSIAQQGMGQDEAVFTDEANLEHQTFLWSDKYKPRKPRYFNRVHTGFDWNKYNQTHYDIDNSPPKIVQGYRFNIFYPDLLDKTETPKFKLIECDDTDFAILRFTCGPPYEDIAFKIVNREWEFNHKHGYKCQFQNGIFQLWFFFKRYRYRR